MTPVTAIPSLPAANAAARVTRISAEGRDSHRSDGQRAEDEATHASRATASDDPALSRVRANLAAVFAEARATGASPGELAERVEAVLKIHGVDLDRAHGLRFFHAYGKIVTHDKLGHVQLADPPEPGSVRQLSMAIEAALQADPAEASMASVWDAILGVNVTV